MSIHNDFTDNDDEIVSIYQIIPVLIYLSHRISTNQPLFKKNKKKKKKKKL